jgi:nucleolar protein 14
MLSQCSVTGANDFVSGLFVVSLCLEYATLAERFMPEAVVFLTGVLRLGSDADSAGNDLTSSGPGFQSLMDSKEARFLKKGAAANAKSTLKPLSLNFIADELQQTPSMDWQLSVLGLALNQATSLAKLYRSHTSYEAIFAPVRSAVDRLQLKSKSPLATVATEFLASSEKPGTSLWPLTMQAHKPVPLNSIEPDFADVFTGRKGGTMEKDDRERAKLKALHKKEMRGAIREIRKDAKFIANEKQRERQEFVDERNKVVAKYENSLAQDQGAYNTSDKMELKRKGKLR